MDAHPLLAGILGSDLDGYLMWDLTTSVVHYSRRWCVMLGFESQGVSEVNDLWKCLLHPADLVAAEEALRSCIESFWPLSGTWRMLHGTGDWRYIRWTGHIQRSPDGNAMNLVCRCTDVTEAQRASAREKAIFDTIPDTVFVVNPNNFEVFAHRESAAQSGELLSTGTQFIELPEIAALVQECAEGASCQKDIETTVMGARRSLEVRCHRYATNESVILIRDFTERRRIDEQLAQSQKLESIGQLAAGVAHEINTPMQYIGDNLSFLGTAFADLELVLSAALDRPTTRDEFIKLANSLDVAYLRENLQTSIANSQEGVQRVSQIVSAMKDFSHQGSSERASCDVNRSLKSAATVSASQWRHFAQVQFDLDPDLPLPIAYGAELNQVFLNLIINAAHAIRDANKQTGALGTITVRSRTVGTGVRVEIVDTGTGIPAAIAHRVFDPFFTTKVVGEGTGQGLTLSREIVAKRHGGSLTFETAEGAGTTMRVDLPLA